MQKTYNQAVFFDLDGTLLDTAPDLTSAINQVLYQYNKPPVSADQLRWHMHGGSRTLLAHSMNISKTDPKFISLQTDFINYYKDNFTDQTIFFEGIPELLNYLDDQAIPWGIVTNKPTFLTMPLLEHFNLHQRPTCIICGDTLTVCKPNPAPLLYACQQTLKNPQHCLYVGDTEMDAIAAKAAGMQAMSALYGYRREQTNPNEWDTDYRVQKSNQLLPWFKRNQQNWLPL